MATRRRAQSRTPSPLSPTSPTLDTTLKPTLPPTPTTPGLPLLLKWSDLPSWQQDNHYILSHYRPASNSYLGSFQSLFYLHNESVNIHTHLLGAFLFFFMSFSIYAFDTRAVSIEDIIAFACFFAGAWHCILCLGISATFHAISNHSPSVQRWGNQLDYVGIVALITGSFVPSVFYGFYCEPTLQKVYWGMISTFGAGCTIISLNPKFRSPIWRPWRASMFIAMGLSAIFPVLHGLKMYGIRQMNGQIGLFWLVLQGFLYILGACIYAARIPERFYPGKFDRFGSSHQIFHILILLAAMAHLIGLLHAFDHAKHYAQC